MLGLRLARWVLGLEGHVLGFGFGLARWVLVLGLVLGTEGHVLGLGLAR